MKDWIAKHYPDYTGNAKKNKQIIEESWAAISEVKLRSLLESMPLRCEAVIAAGGRHIPW